jgi:hypothetical protein
MSTYEDLYGKRIKVFDSDPTLTSSYEGQVWYDSSTGALKTTLLTKAWSSTAPFPAAYMSTGSGPQTASCFWGGAPPSPSGRTDTVEYNGSGFSTGGALNDAVFQASGYGTQTAAVDAFGRAGGSNKSSCEEYDGSSWTTGNSVNTGRYNASGTGTLTAGLTFGGTGTPNYHQATEEYDGTNFSNGGNLNTKRGYSAGFGTQTAACMAFGLTDPGGVNNSVEEYDGSSWTTVTNYPVSVGYGAGAGTQTSGLAWSFSPPQNITCTYDGTSWTVTGATAATNGSNIHYGNMGTQTAAIAAGRPNSSAAEEFHSSVSVVTAGAFASTPNLNTSYNQRSGSGITDACLCFGGEGPPGVQAINESFDGSSWSELNDLNTARSDLAGCGTQTASLAFGGSPGPGPIAKATEEWDGSSWTTSGILNQESRFCKGAGIQTAAYRVGGFISPGSGSTNAVEHYDGSSWTSQTAAPFTSNRHCALGIQTAGFVNRASPPNFASYDYNGSSWTAGPNDLQSDSQASCFGTATSSMFGSGPPTKCTVWNDTNFATSPNLGSGKGYSASFNAPSSASGMMYGQGNSSEKFTGETTAITSKTLTTS